MIQISDNTQQIQPPRSGECLIRRWNMTVCSASRWENRILPPRANVVEAGCRAIREGKTKYSENAGLLALRQAIARYLARTEGLSYDPASQIVVRPELWEHCF